MLRRRPTVLTLTSDDVKAYQDRREALAFQSITASAEQWQRRYRPSHPQQQHQEQQHQQHQQHTQHAHATRAAQHQQRILGPSQQYPQQHQQHAAHHSAARGMDLSTSSEEGSLMEDEAAHGVGGILHHHYHQQDPFHDATDEEADGHDHDHDDDDDDGEIIRRRILAPHQSFAQDDYDEDEEHDDEDDEGEATDPYEEEVSYYPSRFRSAAQHHYQSPGGRGARGPLHQRSHTLLLDGDETYHNEVHRSFHDEDAENDHDENQAGTRAEESDDDPERALAEARRGDMEMRDAVMSEAGDHEHVAAADNDNAQPVAAAAEAAGQEDAHQQQQRRHQQRRQRILRSPDLAPPPVTATPASTTITTTTTTTTTGIATVTFPPTPQAPQRITTRTTRSMSREPNAAAAQAQMAAVSASAQLVPGPGSTPAQATMVMTPPLPPIHRQRPAGGAGHLVREQPSRSLRRGGGLGAGGGGVVTPTNAGSGARTLRGEQQQQQPQQQLDAPQRVTRSRDERLGLSRGARR